MSTYNKGEMVTNVSMSEQEILDIVMDAVLDSKRDISDHEVFERIVDEVMTMITNTEFVDEQELVDDIGYLVYSTNGHEQELVDDIGYLVYNTNGYDHQHPDEIEPIPEGW